MWSGSRSEIEPRRCNVQRQGDSRSPPSRSYRLLHWLGGFYRSRRRGCAAPPFFRFGFFLRFFFLPALPPVVAALPALAAAVPVEPSVVSTSTPALPAAVSVEPSAPATAASTLVLVVLVHINCLMPIHSLGL